MAAFVGLSGCTALPRSGPDDTLIRKQATLYFAAAADQKPLLNYALVDLTPTVLTYFPTSKVESFSRGFGATKRKPPELPLGSGDVVAVTIFESSAGGLFIPAESGTRPGNYVTLPQQRVDTRGMISVPYAGEVPAAGRLPAAVEADIRSRLADRAIEPQVVINVVTSTSSQAAVLGDVNGAARFEVTAGGERVLDLISRAGGISSPSRETTVTLQRNGTTATVPFDLLLEKPEENIFVYPGDTIYANRDRRTFLAFGASGLNGRIDFEESNLTLAEAVGKAGGLLDARADPGQVFLYRLVSPEVLAKIGMPVAAKATGGFPVIFRVDMRDPSTYFLAQQFAMQDKDILYVSNSDSTEVVKFLSVINSVSSGVAGPAVDIASGRTAVNIIRN
ncbi:sugar ABC transporter substrate-binding protein [Aureimonas sp. SA4125]|uniref:polysaccharide biosynthesis/export family protein n=1 Tax=Aureimonas sp. SA4125 TaxID=2826993 RepID=UPI001CC34C9F|nr:polysaccharide biosynthesis/export family protein [Aureimonas sp. SA4125]BDA83370.1 sugar ABC transporter substrate-binding protein [Aureimonas sp. SA4125]